MVGPIYAARRPVKILCRGTRCIRCPTQRWCTASNGRPPAQILHENPETLRSAAMAAAIRSAISGGTCRPDISLRAGTSRQRRLPGRISKERSFTMTHFPMEPQEPESRPANPTRIYRALALFGGATGLRSPRDGAGWASMCSRSLSVDMSVRPCQSSFARRGKQLSEPT